LKQRGGFAGTASFDGDVAVWNHEIDFGPINGKDTARLERKSPTSVLEKGLDGDFFELWWSMSSGDGKYLGIKIYASCSRPRDPLTTGDQRTPDLRGEFSRAHRRRTCDSRTKRTSERT